MILDKLIPKKEDVKGLANGTKENLVSNAKRYLDLKNGPLKESFELAKTAAIAKLISESKDLGNKILDVEVRARKAASKVNKDKSLTEFEKGIKIQLIENSRTDELKILGDNLNIKRLELQNQPKAYLNQLKTNYLTKKRLLLDKSEAAKNFVKFGNKPKVNPTSIILALGAVSNFIIANTTISNKKIENLVDRVNDFIRNIQNEGDITKARLLVSNAKTIIGQNRERLKKIKQIVDVVQLLLPILDVILALFKINPIPTTFATVGITTLAANKDKKLEDIKLALVVLLGIISQILAELLRDLDYQESRLLPIDDLLTNNPESLLPESDTGPNPSTSNPSDSLSSSNNSAEDRFNAKNSLDPVEDLLDQYSSKEILGNGLGYLEGYDYKGFRFFVREEVNSRFIVKGNKRRYMIAKNRLDQEVLQSSYSFTLEPDVLAEELKLLIDQKGLVA
jgi:hypothetical protein